MEFGSRALIFTSSVSCVPSPLTRSKMYRIVSAFKVIYTCLKFFSLKWCIAIFMNVSVTRYVQAILRVWSTYLVCIWDDATVVWNWKRNKTKTCIQRFVVFLRTYATGNVCVYFPTNSKLLSTNTTFVLEMSNFRSPFHLDSFFENVLTKSDSSSRKRESTEWRRKHFAKNEVWEWSTAKLIPSSLMKSSFGRNSTSSCWIIWADRVATFWKTGKSQGFSQPEKMGEESGNCQSFD